MKPVFTLAALLAIGAAALTPIAAQAHGNPYQQVQYGYHSGPRHAEPVQRYERIPPPRHGYKWVPSHWKREGRNTYWINGYWMPVHRGHGHGGYGGHGEHRRDIDRDGTPNRYDRDRDGDGIPNHADRHPDNRYR